MVNDSREVFIVGASNTMANNLLNENETLRNSIHVDRDVALVYISVCLIIDGLMSLEKRQSASFDLEIMDNVIDRYIPGGSVVMKDYMEFLKDVGERKLGELFSAVGEKAGRRYCVSLYLHNKLRFSETEFPQKKLEADLGERCFPGIEMIFEKISADDWRNFIREI
jgi:hypothetical protein